MALVLAAGCAVGCGARSDASQVVARVGSDEISVHQLNFVMHRLGAVPPEQADSAGRALLDRLIEQELAVQAAVESKLDRNPQVMLALAAARREVLAQAWIASIGERTAAVDAARVAAYYAAHPARYAQRHLYRVVEIVVQAPSETIEALRRQLQSTHSLDDVIARLRAAGLGAKTNETTLAADVLPPLLESLNTMKDGQAMMLASAGGARIVYRAASQSAPLTLDAAKPAIERILIAEDRQAAVQRALDERRRGADVRYLGRFAQASTAPASAAAARATPAASDSADAASVRRGLQGL